MEKNNIILIVIISVIAILLAGYTIPTIIEMPPGQHSGDGEGPTPPAGLQPAVKEGNVSLKTLVSFINLGLVLPLFVIYAGIYRQIRSSFTLGLLAVIFALGMYAVTSNPIIVTALGGIPGYIGIYQIVPDLCATAALITLIRISLE